MHLRNYCCETAIVIVNVTENVTACVGSNMILDALATMTALREIFCALSLLV